MKAKQTKTKLYYACPCGGCYVSEETWGFMGGNWPEPPSWHIKPVQGCPKCDEHPALFYLRALPSEGPVYSKDDLIVHKQGVES